MQLCYSNSSSQCSYSVKRNPFLYTFESTEATFEILPHIVSIHMKRILFTKTIYEFRKLVQFGQLSTEKVYQGPPNSQHWYKISGGLFILLSSSSTSPFFVTLVGHFFWHFSYVKVSYCGKSFFVRTLFCHYFWSLGPPWILLSLLLPWLQKVS